MRRWIGCFEQYCEALFAQERFGSRPQAERRSRLEMAPEEPVAIRFRSHAAERGIILDPEMKFGEAYMDGSVVVEEGSIADVLPLSCASSATAGRRSLPDRNGSFAIFTVGFCNSIRARGRDAMSRNHYDLDGQLLLPVPGC